MNSSVSPIMIDAVASASICLGLELFLGACVDFAVSVFTTILVLKFVEKKRRAELQISEGCPLTLPDRSKRVGVRITNPAMGGCLAKIYDRESAMACRVWLKFRDRNGCPIQCPEGFPVDWIPGRWDQAPEPMYYRYDKSGELSEFRFGHIPYEIDIASASDSRTVQVAVWTPDCHNYFVWNDEVLARLSRETEMPAELAKLQLMPGCYKVEVKVTTLGRPYLGTFLLEIPRAGGGDFRLSPFADDLARAS